MKRFKKYFYYTLIFISAVQLLFYLFAPFGGYLLLLIVIKNGLYESKYFGCVDSKIIYQVLQAMNSVIASVYFIALIFCLITLIFKNHQRRYKFGIYSGLIPIVILVLGIFVKYFGC